MQDMLAALARHPLRQRLDASDYVEREEVTTCRHDVLDYQQPPSLQEVQLVAHDERRAGVWRRGRAGWSQRSARERAELVPLERTLPLELIYFDALPDALQARDPR